MVQAVLHDNLEGDLAWLPFDGYLNIILEVLLIWPSQLWLPALIGYGMASCFERTAAWPALPFWQVCG